MKLKCLLKSFFILGLTLLPISFINAESLTTTGGGIYVESSNAESFTLGNYTYDLDLIGNISSNDSPFLYKTATNNYINLQFAFGWIDGKLYNISAWGNTNIVQGFVSKFCIRDSFPTSTNNICPESITADEFYQLDGPFDSISFGLADSTNWNYAQTNFNPFSLCFKKGSNYYCAIYSYNGPNNGYSGSLSFSNASFDSLSEYSWGSSPFSNTPTYYYSTGSCPSVGQLKANSNLTPNVCYAGFSSSDIYGDSSTFVAGQGLSIFDVYNMYSGGMLLQGRYDTYYSYYKNINSNVSMFEGRSKALLGTFFARQTFSDGLIGSYKILNYCYYVVNNIPDSTSTCVSNNVSSQYSGIVIDSNDREDILDSIIGWQDSVRIQSGFDTGDLTDIYNQSYSLFSSWTIDPGFNGIIPSYIVIGFLGIVLLYFLRR